MKTKNKSRPRKIQEPITVQMTFPGRTKLAQFVAIATKMGLVYEPKLIPKEVNIYKAWPDDIEPVKKLIAEAKRLLVVATKTLMNDNVNGATAFIRQAWAFAFAAAWLRCEAKGEFKKKGHEN